MSMNLGTRLRQFAAPGKLAAALVLLSSALAAAAPSDADQTLKSPAEFASIANKTERSRAIFREIGKLVTHPRCMNCHPAGDHPLQGDDQHEHMPPVWRGETGHLETNCFGCHTERNVTLHEAASYKSIPGNPRWGIAPISMTWQNKSLGEICRQLKDVNFNGGRDLALLQEHIAKDDLVAHGWDPGEGRVPAPGSQKAAGELVQAWIDSGAECPP
ncbi:MAG TPA: Isoquinoline 1-oxidoreductase subunit [Bradyrhizobium sp.]|nr:Isoquinoline 1-oxidoreductase subunit [Bradyrhizobium sp.]